MSRKSTFKNNSSYFCSSSEHLVCLFIFTLICIVNYSSTWELHELRICMAAWSWGMRFELSLWSQVQTLSPPHHAVFGVNIYSNLFFFLFRFGLVIIGLGLKSCFALHLPIVRIEVSGRCLESFFCGNIRAFLFFFNQKSSNFFLKRGYFVMEV